MKAKGGFAFIIISSLKASHHIQLEMATLNKGSRSTRLYIRLWECRVISTQKILNKKNTTSTTLSIEKVKIKRKKKDHYNFSFFLLFLVLAFLQYIPNCYQKNLPSKPDRDRTRGKK